MLDTEVCILGGGPAGACAAANVAPLYRTVVIDHRTKAGGRLVETLPPVAGTLLADMNLLGSLAAQGHLRWEAKRSVWDDGAAAEETLLGDPDGLGWILDRPRFETWIRDEAIRRGATVMAPAELATIERTGTGWRLGLSTPSGSREVTARVVIDAAGRSAPLSARLSARRVKLDRLICGWIEGHDQRPGGGGWTYVHAAPDGWWFTACITDGRRVVAFHTDRDLPAARTAAQPLALVRTARALPDLGDLLADAGFVADGANGLCTAHSAVLAPCGGPGWLAAGDAALSLDPVSSQGLLNALVTGLAAAECVDTHLSGLPDAHAGYVAAIAARTRRYVAEISGCYARVSRYPGEPFWRRRRAMPAAVLPGLT